MNCGLIFIHEYQEKAVPLKAVSVEVSVQGFVASVRATLSYLNAEAFPVEASFLFPLDDDSAVHAFSASLNGRHIDAVIKEKEKAKEEYDDAMSSGHTAFLLSEDRGDVFQCMLGNLGAGEGAELRVEFVSELAVEPDGAVRFCLPTVLNPRYTPPDSSPADSALPFVPFVSCSQPLPYSMAFRLRAEAPGGIAAVTSACDLGPVSFSGPGNSVAEVSLGEGFKMDRDVELFVHPIQKHRPFALLEAGGTAKASSLMSDTVAMLNFFPDAGETKSAKGAEALTQKGEFIFVVDCSGSMECPMVNDGSGGRETRIHSAKETLMLLLKSLPLGCFFNVYAFGSSYNSFFPESREYSQASMDEALKLVKGMSANLGGTEILEPLVAIYRSACRPEHPRQLMVLTDGEVSNTRDVISLVKKNASKHRCFSFGIGDGASTELIKGIAASGGGTAEFITGKERLQGKVLKALKCALQPTLTSVSLSWSLPPGLSAIVVPEVPRSIFLGQRTILYAQLAGTAPAAPWQGEAVLKYSLHGESVENRVPVTSQTANPGESRATLHWLAAKAMIRHLVSGPNTPDSTPAPEDAEQQKKKNEEEEAEAKSRRERVVALSVESGVVSPYTAFVGVDTDSRQPLGAAMQERPTPRHHFFGGSGFSVVCDSSSYSMDVVDAAPKRGAMRSMMPMASPMMCAPVAKQRSKRSIFGGMFASFKKSPPQKTAFNRGSMQSMMPMACPMMPAPVASRCCSSSAKMSMPEMIMNSPCRSDDLHGPGDGQEAMECDYFAPDTPAELPFLELVDLQRAHGAWELSAQLASVVQSSEEALRKEAPAGVSDEVWATVVALVWLHALAPDHHDEWELLALKASAWLRGQAVDLTLCVKAANQLLKTNVDVGKL
ncbi:von Willebrand factor A domain-containing protein 5A-like isoform X2 [Lethenteron reissneri]|uniref:von Willebrand factor A domain-containing protein 5A-like isoform X2 n=1 Tax=Lethenteron reissneri TaxID=7753 RepID=UPI002AB6001E|nr:von Willebrand factor A domain-containing protein 5A-like isoform X2 [Lethenteron reissneri]